MSGLIWFLVVGVLFYFMMRGGCGAHAGHGGHQRDDADRPQDKPAGGVDPVCGMRVEPDSGYAKIYRGVQYRFCSRDCLDRFDASPDQFLGQKHDAMGHQGHSA